MASVAAGCDQCNGQPTGTFVPADSHQSPTRQVRLRLTPRCGVRTYPPTETGQPHEVILMTARQPPVHLAAAMWRTARPAAPTLQARRGKTSATHQPASGAARSPSVAPVAAADRCAGEGWS